MIRPRRTLISAALLVLVSSLLGCWIRGFGFAVGIVFSGLLVLLSFWLTGRRLGRLTPVHAAGETPSRFWILLGSLHLVAMLVLAWLLLARYEPLSLLIGFSSVPVTIMLQTLWAILRGPRMLTLEN